MSQDLSDESLSKERLDSLLVELTKHGIHIKLSEENRLLVNAPKGVVSENLKRQLAESKAVLIEWLKQNNNTSKKEPLPTIVPDVAHRYDPFPMADLQTGFFIGQNEDMEFYVRPHFYIEEDFDELDVVRFEEALNIALHHQRYNFPIVTPDLQLKIPETLQPFSLEIYDLRDLSDEEAQASLLKTRELMSRETLPLDHWPTEDFRVSLYAGKRVRLHFNHNNFFGDGYGASKFFSTAMDYYHHGKVPSELSLTFRDCVLALSKLEESSLGQISRRYWEERLLNLPTAPPIPFISNASTRTRSKLTVRKIKLAATLWGQFKRLAYQFGLTPNNAITALYAEVISHWSGSRHFLLNNMVTHRFPMHPEMISVLGNFASLYPLEVDWRGGGSFSKRALQLQERLISDMSHLYWGGMKVLQALNQIQKSPGRATCPFVVGSGLHIKGWKEFYYSCLETPQVLLDYQFWELTDGSLLVAWDLIESFFPLGLIDSMQYAFQTLLTHLSQHEKAWELPSFDLLPPTQREQRALINNTESVLSNNLLHDGLANSAVRYPDKPAIITTNGQLTYAQLYSLANRLGHCLRDAGAQPNQFIAVIHDKGWEQVVAVLGILAAGSPYVPIDPNWPPQRIEYILRNIDACIVVTSSKQKILGLPNNVRIIYVDSELDHFSEEALLPVQTPDDLAYVIYTSGSTGVPKGVMISHRAALNTIVDVNERFGVRESDVLFGISSLYFDLSVYDIFGAIWAGATLVLPSVVDPDPTQWINSIQRHGVTIWNSVPALMQLLVDSANSSGTNLPSLKLILMSGDWIPVSLPDQIRRMNSQVQIVSLGGATEASIWSIYYLINEVDPTWASIPYGRPLANQSWHILDENGQDVPVWVPGQLYISGTGIASGYWRDEEKTAAAFTVHSSTQKSLYRTGDIGRYLPDGNIEFLGRADFQVKIQGYRVELGEIESSLLQYPDIRKAVVIANNSDVGKKLIAFVELHPDKHFDMVGLQSFLRTKLPAYMVPANILSLDEFPLTNNGKVDRAALAKLSVTGAANYQFVAPRNDLERALVMIWEEVLAVHPIGVKDDFFHLGGQSFAAIRVMNRVMQQFGRRLPLATLLESPTIEALACSLQQDSKQEIWTPLVQLSNNGRDKPFFVVHPAGGNVMCYRALAEKLGRPFYGLQAPGIFPDQKPLQSVEQMAALYLSKLREQYLHGPYLLGGWSSGGMIAFEIASQLEKQKEKVECVVMIDAPAPMQYASVDDATLLLWFIEDLNIGVNVPDLKRQECGTFSAVIDYLREHQSISSHIDTKQLERIFDVFVNIVRAGRHYKPTPINSDIFVIRARDGMVSEFLDHPAYTNEDWGWKYFTKGKIQSAIVPGSHYTILNQPNLDILVAELQKHIMRGEFFSSTNPIAMRQ